MQTPSSSESASGGASSNPSISGHADHSAASPLHRMVRQDSRSGGLAGELRVPEPGTLKHMLTLLQIELLRLDASVSLAGRSSGSVARLRKHKPQIFLAN
ncbi:hypothetical protein AB1Y20_005692 [Prymnesium parvum]|uniref:Uncharacterized protein n=1 Tax=Prymnesium parvum TaxID=97485 RepID=A0AB34J0H8_PRYPA|mmetsp:Transcript_21786/g.54297  ORF Transcript_21786/g.54297 Transcript_21786/m.54297 type:complete len:100 (+) Transcript_21786:361-660(+)